MKASKGQTVYFSKSWNGLNVRVVRELIVHSWGKKVAKFKDAHTGDMIQEQEYLNDGDHPAIFPSYREALTHSMNDLQTNIEKRLNIILDDKASREARGFTLHPQVQETLSGYERDGLVVHNYEYALFLMRERSL